jgi:hypothetical protein
MTILSLQSAEEKNVLGRVHRVARFYNDGVSLPLADAIDLVVDRLTEAERKLAKVANALNGDGRRRAA